MDSADIMDNLLDNSPVRLSAAEDGDRDNQLRSLLIKCEGHKDYGTNIIGH